ncbi:helix-turn-helix transcriptional regulator [Leucobacter denitrificans]|uniref:Helix-turn-helix transcriptional regulator n=1 Tax=Leucobacter denitrificans TaxID=683042 RepID=A0A7G9S870_9MICO|nr:helix-turn-helix transcriptional regulator [Leucobacter denitrificans]
MLLRPTPALQRLLEDAVDEFARATKFALAFGGYESEGITTVTALSGNHGSSLHELRVANTRGLGGRAMIEHRPRFTPDYISSQKISHDYDTEIGAEGIVMLVAVPVLVEGQTRAVLYGGTRGESPPDGTFMRAAAGVAQELASEIQLLDERGLASRAPAPQPLASLPGSVLEELRSSHAELRRIAADTTDRETRDRLVALEQRLANIGHVAPPNTVIKLTPREADVLSQAALGATNAEIGLSLGITESTVKSYLKTAMAKLEASTRHAAVAAARGFGLIP